MGLMKRDLNEGESNAREESACFFREGAKRSTSDCESDVGPERGRAGWKRRGHVPAPGWREDRNGHGR